MIINRPPGFVCRRRGLTLLEVLIALSVLGVFLLPVILALTQALTTSTQSTTVVAATSIARQTVERLKSVGYDNVQSSPEPTPADLKPGDGYFEVTTSVALAAGVNSVKEIVVSVRRTGSQEPLAVLRTLLIPVGV